MNISYAPNRPLIKTDKAKDVWNFRPILFNKPVHALPKGMKEFIVALLKCSKVNAKKHKTSGKKAIFFLYTSRIKYLSAREEL